MQCRHIYLKNPSIQPTDPSPSNGRVAHLPHAPWAPRTSPSPILTSIREITISFLSTHRHQHHRSKPDQRAESSLVPRPLTHRSSVELSRRPAAVARSGAALQPALRTTKGERGSATTTRVLQRVGCGSATEDAGVASLLVFLKHCRCC